MRQLRKIGILTAALVLFTVPGFAADEEAEYEGLPAYTVTRLKIFEGSAWVRTPDSGDWEEFSTNSPVPARSMISIPEGSEAELQFHGGQFVLLTAGTELYLQGIRDDGTAFRLRSGEIRFYLPANDFAPVRVTVPGGGKTEFPVPGRYWLTVSDFGDTTLVVREGEGTIRTERGEFRVRTGDQATIGKEVQIGRYSDSDADRDTYEEPPPLSDSEKQAGVPPAAAHELREYGEWVYLNEYGYVWRPRVSPGWSPYYYGRWAWVSPYGWTWISYEPWGWYPYHYGYWHFDPVFAWVWYPFRSFVSFSFVFGGHHFHHFHRHAHFVPANVRFIRDGGRVRWVPLRPGERTRRIAFTRSDTRLSGWSRPLDRGTVFVRRESREGSRNREWRDWTAVRRERREAARTDAAPLRGGERRERVIDRSVRGKGERPQERVRETDRFRGESPARQRRWERDSAPSRRPDRRSDIRPERSGKTSAREKNERRRWERVTPSGKAPPARAVSPSPSGRVERTPPASRFRSVPDGGGRARGLEKREAPVARGRADRSPSFRSSAPQRSGGSRGSVNRGGGGRGSVDFGTWGGRGGGSIR